LCNFDSRALIQVSGNRNAEVRARQIGLRRRALIVR
jgi:hypothetical protein